MDKELLNNMYVTLIILKVVRTRIISKNFNVPTVKRTFSIKNDRSIKTVSSSGMTESAVTVAMKVCPQRIISSS